MDHTFNIYTQNGPYDEADEYVSTYVNPPVHGIRTAIVGSMILEFNEEVNSEIFHYCLTQVDHETVVSEDEDLQDLIWTNTESRKKIHNDIFQKFGYSHKVEKCEIAAEDQLYAADDVYIKYFLFRGLVFTLLYSTPRRLVQHYFWKKNLEIAEDSSLANRFFNYPSYHSYPLKGFLGRYNYSFSECQKVGDFVDDNKDNEIVNNLSKIFTHTRYLVLGKFVADLGDDFPDDIVHKAALEFYERAMEYDDDIRHQEIEEDIKGIFQKYDIVVKGSYDYDIVKESNEFNNLKCSTTTRFVWSYTLI